VSDCNCDGEFEYMEAELREMQECVRLLRREMAEVREELRAEKTRRMVLSGRMDRSEYR
jgi:hypothetical protein